MLSRPLGDSCFKNAPLLWTGYRGCDTIRGGAVPGHGEASEQHRGADPGEPCLEPGLCAVGVSESGTEQSAYL